MVVRGVLLDIEGTTSSIRFVYDQMFPFVRGNLNTYLDQHWGEDDLCKAAALIADEAGNDIGKPVDREALSAEVLRLMDSDVKSTGLKQLQGLIWRSGFHSGELRAHVYEDVPEALRRWHDAGIDIRIYSSGSIEAQHLFFGHSIAGNLLPYFSGHYDTTSGGKKEAASYKKIVEAFALPPAEVMFVSDVVAELDAATTAGMQTRLSMRPGNPPQEAGSHVVIHSFDELTF